MADPIGRLRAELSANAARFASDMGKARNTAQSFGARIQRSFASARKEINRSVSRMLSFGSAIAAIATPAVLGGLIKRSIEAADAIGKTADATGLSTDAFQELRFAADLAGVGQEKFAVGMRMFAKNLGDARRGTGALSEALRRLDPALLDAVRSAPDTETALRMVLERMQSMPDAASKAGLAAAAFGESGVAMVNMLKDGTAGLDAARRQARELGVVMDEQLVRQAEAAQDRLSALATVLSTSVTINVAKLAPMIADLAEDFFKGATAIARWTRGIGEFVGMAAGPVRRELAELDGQLAIVRDQVDEKRKAIQKAREATGLWGVATRQLGQNLPQLHQELADALRFEAKLTAQRQTLAAELDALRGLEKARGAAAGEGARADADAAVALRERLLAMDQANRLEAERQALLREAGAVIDSTLSIEAQRNEEIAKLNRLKPQIIQLLGDEATAELVLQDAIAQTNAKYDQAAHKAKQTESRTRELGRAAIRAGEQLSDGFVQGALAGDKLSDTLKDLQRQLIQLAAQAAFRGLLFGTGPMGGFFGGGIFGSGPVAGKGLALSGGRVTRYGSGGVLNSPMTFPTRDGVGLAGERQGRSEGIFPLTRVGTELGVRAEIPPGAGGVHVHQTNVIQAADITSPATLRRLLRGVADAARDGVDSASIRAGRALSDADRLHPRRAV